MTTEEFLTAFLEYLARRGYLLAREQEQQLFLSSLQVISPEQRERLVREFSIDFASVRTSGTRVQEQSQ